MVDSSSAAATPFDNLNAQSLVGDGIEITALPICIKLNLRGSGAADFQNGVATALGLVPPVQPNTVNRNSAGGSENALFWLGPDEWQLRCTTGATQSESAELMVERVRKALDSQHSAVVDVSDYYAVMRLSGARVFEILAKGSPLDCRQALGDARCCAQTRFGHANVLLDRVDDGSEVLCIDLQVRWSLVESVWQQLELAVMEFQEHPASSSSK